MSVESTRGWFGKALLVPVLAVMGAALTAQAPAPAEPTAARHDDARLQWAPCPDIFPSGCEVTVLQGDPAKGRADVFLRTPAGYRFPPHSHTSSERIILVTGEMEVRYQAREPISVRAGGYAFVPGSVPHAATCGNAGPCVLFIAFESPIDAKPAQGKF